MRGLVHKSAVNMLRTISEGVRLSLPRLSAKAQPEAGLQETMEGLWQLVGGIAHDCNNSMAAVLMGAEILDTSMGAGHRETALMESLLQKSKAFTKLLREILLTMRNEKARKPGLA